MSYQDVFDKLINSYDVTVGGGSASAISGAMAAGLVGMVSRLFVKQEYGLTADEYLEIARKADDITVELLYGAEEDAYAFSLIKDAYKLPKSNNEEKSLRIIAIEKAARKAADIPKKNAYKCREVLNLALMLKGNSNTNAESDLDIGINLCKVAILGCISNIMANIPLIKNETTLKMFEDDICLLRNNL